MEPSAVLDLSETARQLILLLRLWGPMDDPGGQVTRQLRQLVHYTGEPAAFNIHLKRLTSSGIFEIKGQDKKRNYQTRVLPPYDTEPADLMVRLPADTMALIAKRNAA